MEYKFNRAWAEVNLDNIVHNLGEIKRLIDGKTEICGVVKADAYGHGVSEIVKILLQNGVTYLAVSMLDEAIQLRKEGVKVPILVLGYTDPIRAEEIISYEVTQTVFSHELAIALSNAAVRMSKDVKIHIKIDTGMNRVGFCSGYSSVKDIIKIGRLPRIIVEGLFTHFSSADEIDDSYTKMQFEFYMSIISELNRIGLYIPIKHVCNSAGFIQYPYMQLNMIRPGISMYGFYPSENIDKNIINLKPAMTLKANVILVKEVEKDSHISYGRTFKTRKKSKIATIPIGYADGYTRLLSDKGKVIINGEIAPVVGRMCMDQCMVDITDLNTDVSVGDEVVLFGKQRDEEIRVEDIASSIGTINYEIVSIIGKRIPRVYWKDGKIYNVLNYLI